MLENLIYFFIWPNGSIFHIFVPEDWFVFFVRKDCADRDDTVTVGKPLIWVCTVLNIYLKRFMG